MVLFCLFSHATIHAWHLVCDAKSKHSWFIKHNLDVSQASKYGALSQDWTHYLSVTDLVKQIY